MSKTPEQSFCFGNYNPESQKCVNCELNKKCHNDLAGGINASGILGGIDRINQMEQICGKTPDWIYAWDELSDEELATMKTENPSKWNLYNLYSPGLSD